jgi:uncharacterized protein DUF1996
MSGRATGRWLIAAIACALLATQVSPAGAVEGEHRFSVLCRLSHVRQVDPIVSPGPAGTPAAHIHAFFGNRSTDADSDYASMRSAGTTCETRRDRAGYWVPSLVSGRGSVVLPARAFAYYRASPATQDEVITAFPADFRAISDRYVYHCGSMRREGVGPVDCRGLKGGYVTLSILFAPCWDGVRLDSADHRSHLAWPRGLDCPPTHPVEVPFIGLHVRFPVLRITASWSLTSGTLDGAHGDFFNSWDQPTLQRLVTRCLGATKSAGDEVCERVGSRR